MSAKRDADARAVVKKLQQTWRKVAKAQRKAEKLVKNLDQRHESALEKIEAGALEDAIAIYTGMLDESPKLALAWANRGACKARLKDWAGALPDLDQALKLDPLATDWLINRAKAKFNLGDSRGAIEDSALAEGIEPGGEGMNAAQHFITAMRERGELGSFPPPWMQDLGIIAYGNFEQPGASE